MLAFKGRSIFAITRAFVGYAIGFGDRGSIGMLTPAVFNKSRNSVGGFKFGPSSDFAFSIMDTRGSRQSERSPGDYRGLYCCGVEARSTKEIS